MLVPSHFTTPLESNPTSLVVDDLTTFPRVRHCCRKSTVERACGVKIGVYPLHTQRYVQVILIPTAFLLGQFWRRSIHMSCPPQACYTLRRRTTEYTSLPLPLPSQAWPVVVVLVVHLSQLPALPSQSTLISALPVNCALQTSQAPIVFNTTTSTTVRAKGQDKKKKKSRLDCALLRVATPTIVAQSCADLTAIACSATPRPTSVAHCLSSCAIGITISPFHPTTWPVGLPNSHTSSSCSCIFRCTIPFSAKPPVAALHHCACAPFPSRRCHWE